MTIKKYRIPAFLLAALIAVAMTFAMAVTTQSAYAVTGDEYELDIEGVDSVVPGETLNLTAIVKKNGEVTNLPEGSKIKWHLGDFTPDEPPEEHEKYKKAHVISNETTANLNRDYDKFVQVLSNDTTRAVIEFNTEYVEDPYGIGFGLGAILVDANGVKIGDANDAQFQLANVYDEVRYVNDDSLNQYPLAGEEQTIGVKVTRHAGGDATPLKVKYIWNVDNSGVQVLRNGRQVSDEEVSDDDVDVTSFTFKRVDTSKDTEVLLTIMGMDGSIIEQNCAFCFNQLSTDLADYQIEFNGSAEDYFVFVDKDDLPVETLDNPACKITVVSGNGDGYELPKEAYTLKVQKVIGYDENTWEDILEDVDFKLNVDDVGKSNINGDRTEGTAQYLITAVAKSDSGFTGQTDSKKTGWLWLLDRKTLTWPAVNAGFPDKNYNIYQFRYEAKIGKKLTPFVTSAETSRNLTQNKDYKVTYINKKTNKVYSSFPTKAGNYRVVFSGLSPYYGENDNFDLFVGKKNTIKAKGKTIICKTKMKKGKTKKSRSFKASRAVKVTKAKGTVSYSKVSGNKNITVSDSGKIKVKKGTKRGTYKIKVEVTAQGNSTYIAGSKTVTVKVKVK